MQENYVSQIVEGVAPYKAAELAGFAHPSQAVGRLGANKPLQKEIMRRLHHRLVEGAAPVAVKFLAQLVADETANKGLRLKAAQYVIDKAETIVGIHSLDDLLDKSVMDMDEAELHLFIMQGKVILRKTKEEQELEQMGIIINNENPDNTTA